MAVHIPFVPDEINIYDIGLARCAFAKDFREMTAEIDVRGEMSYDKIYFNADDVGRYFDIENLHEKIRDYEYDVHYTHFKTRKNDIAIYLTYEGLIRLMLCENVTSHKHVHATLIQQLFAIHTDHKGTVMDMDTKSLGYMLDLSETTMPCVYLIHLGCVRQLRDYLNIPSLAYQDDDVLVCLYGTTKNIKQTYNEAYDAYKHNKAFNVYVKEFSYINTCALNEADITLKEYFDTWNLSLNREDDATKIACIKPSKGVFIHEFYKTLSMKYKGHITELTNTIRDLKHKYDTLVHDKEIEASDFQEELKMYKDENEFLRLKLYVCQESKRVSSMFINNI
jgi:hypothetical protein